jgi:DNA-binding MarR family transcriptional regulator
MALAGDLAEFSVPDIIQLVDLSKKTGAVLLRGQRGQDEIEAWLYFRNGKIIGAQLGNLPPLEAAYTCFTFSAGPFRFYDDIQLDTPTITQSNEMIIIEGIARQEAWMRLQEQMPTLSMVPRLVPNPASTGSEISLEAEEWRVLTMVNGKNTVAQIAQRTGLGEARTCEIIARLLGAGLIEKREVRLAETLFPEMERRTIAALGAGGRALLEEAFSRAGIHDRAAATPEQISEAMNYFEAAAGRAFGPARVRQLLEELRAQAQAAS